MGAKSEWLVKALVKKMVVWVDKSFDVIPVLATGSD